MAALVELPCACFRKGRADQPDLFAKAVGRIIRGNGEVPTHEQISLKAQGSLSKKGIKGRESGHLGQG
jgi:hypothetical protein